MNEQDNRLTPQETERLCELFMDCKLSVLEENELRYVLSQIDYHSPLIDEVRKLAGIELAVFDKPAGETPVAGKRWWRNKYPHLSIAASIAILVCSGAILFHNGRCDYTASKAEYIAYVDGHRLSEEAAKVLIEAKIRASDDFIKEMTELEARNQQIIDEFFNP